jgi:hypothetical protein
MALICFASLFLPYLDKINVISGDLSLPKHLEGYNYNIAIVTGVFTAILTVRYVKNQIVTFVVSIAIVLLTYFLRYSIHYQGFDHDYDSKTGLGYLILLIGVLALFLTSFIALITQIRDRK